MFRGHAPQPVHLALHHLKLTHRTVDALLALLQRCGIVQYRLAQLKCARNGAGVFLRVLQFFAQPQKQVALLLQPPAMSSEPGMRGLGALLGAATRHFRNQFDREVTERYLPRRKVDAFDPPVKKHSKDSDGELRLRHLEHLLEHGFEWQRFAFDRALHAEMVKASAELVVGSDWKDLATRIAEERHWPYLRKMVCGKAARRFGKSVAMSKFVAAFCRVMLFGAIHNGDTVTVSTFSTGLRASMGIKAYVFKFLVELGMHEYITSNTQQILVLKASPRDPTSPEIMLKFMPAGSKKYVCFFVCCPLCFLVLAVVFSRFCKAALAGLVLPAGWPGFARRPLRP